MSHRCENNHWATCDDPEHTGPQPIFVDMDNIDTRNRTTTVRQYVADIKGVHRSNVHTVTQEMAAVLAAKLLKFAAMDLDEI